MTPTETQHPATGVRLEPYCTVCGQAAVPRLAPGTSGHADPAADAECTVELGWRPAEWTHEDQAAEDAKHIGEQWPPGNGWPRVRGGVTL